MADESQNIIAEQIKKLPQEVKDMLASNDLQTKIATIGTKNHLHIDQVGILKDEVVLVMMGLADPGEFEAELIEQLLLTKEAVAPILVDVNDSIFLPIQNSMRKFVEEEAKVAAEMPPAREKSVVMPSSAPVAPASVASKVTPPTSPPTPPTPVVIQKPVTPPIPVAPMPVVQTPPPAQSISTPAPVSITPAQPVVPKPAPMAPPPPPPAPVTPKPSPAAGADVMLNETTVSLPKKDPAPKPPPYKADPYREPAE